MTQCTSTMTAVHEEPSTELCGKPSEMETRYDPSKKETLIYEWWEKVGYCKPHESRMASEFPFVICMSPPNVTGDLYMGHAMFVDIKDIMTRYARNERSYSALSSRKES